MAKGHENRLKKKYGEYKNYTELMQRIIADNTERVARAVGKISNDVFEKEAKKTKTKKALVMPDIDNVVLRAQQIRKGEERGKLISDNLRYKLNKDLKDILKNPKYTKTRGPLAGTVKKEAVADFRNTIQKTFENYTKRNPKTGVPDNIRNIAVTEIRAAVNTTKNEFAKQLQSNNPDITLYKMWVHNRKLSKVPRKAHQELNGTEIHFNDNFLYYNDVTGHYVSTPYPHAEGMEAADVIGCSCIPSGSYFMAKNIEKVMRRKYSGKLITIKTKQGLKISVTPEHPIFTDEGWITAERIKITNNIIGVGFTKKFFISDLNIYNRPTAIEKVFNLCKIEFISMRKRGAYFNFNGKGENGKIDIISVNSELRDKINSFCFTPIKNFFFSVSNMRNSFLSTACSFISFSIRNLSSFRDNIGISSKGFSFVFGKFFHSRESSINKISNGNIVASQSISDGCTINIKDFRQFKDRSSLEILGDQKLDIKNFFSGIVSGCVRCDEAKSDGSSRAMEHFSNFVGIKSIFIFIDDIISIDIDSNFSGHVYNLQTNNNNYLLNTIIHNGEYLSSVIHNCECKYIIERN